MISQIAIRCFQFVKLALLNIGYCFISFWTLKLVDKCTSQNWNKCIRYCWLTILMIAIIVYKIYVGDIFQAIKDKHVSPNTVAKSILLLIFDNIVGLMGNIISDRNDELLKKIKADLEAKADKKDLDDKADKKDLDDKADKKDLDDTNAVLEDKADKKDLEDTNAILEDKVDKKDLADTNAMINDKADKKDLAILIDAEINKPLSDFPKLCSIPSDGDDAMTDIDFIRFEEMVNHY